MGGPHISQGSICNPAQMKNALPLPPWIGSPLQSCYSPYKVEHKIGNREEEIKILLFTHGQYTGFGNK